MNFNPYTPEYRQQIWAQWRSCAIRPENTAYVNTTADHIYDTQDRYSAITKVTGIPWYVLAVIHYRESDLNFNTWLANGDPLFKAGVPVQTVNVPAGLGPVDNFQDAAVLSLKGSPLARMQFDIVSSLIEIEAWNGLGYHYHMCPSPYLWSMTDQYTAGKYGSDGQWDPNLIDQQAGCVAILKSLRSNHMIDMKEIAP